MFIAVFFFFLFLLFLLSQQLTRALTAVFHRVFHNQTLSIQLLAVLFLPGVIIHELSHAFVAMLLFVPVGSMEFLPVPDQAGHVKLGSVQIGKTDPFRRAVIGLAPVLVGSMLITVLLYAFLPRSLSALSLPWWGIVGLFYAIFVISNTMFSSRKDLEGTVEIALVLIIVGVILFFAGIRLPEAVIEAFASEQTQHLFQQASLFLAVPLGIDIVIIGAVRLLFRLS